MYHLWEDKVRCYGSQGGSYRLLAGVLASTSSGSWSSEDLFYSRRVLLANGATLSAVGDTGIAATSKSVHSDIRRRC